jgi:hypothetical protein
MTPYAAMHGRIDALFQAIAYHLIGERLTLGLLNDGPRCPQIRVTQKIAEVPLATDARALGRCHTAPQGPRRILMV